MPELRLKKTRAAYSYDPQPTAMPWPSADVVLNREFHREALRCVGHVHEWLTQERCACGKYPSPDPRFAPRIWKP